MASRTPRSDAETPPRSSTRRQRNAAEQDSRQYGVRVVRTPNLELERHPDAPRGQSWRSWVDDQKRRGPIAIDLFSGAGGLSLGLEEAGYTVVLSADHDPASVSTHMANFPGLCLDLDLAEPERVDDLLELLDGTDLDLIAGGPPCQPFSRAGRSKIRDLVDKGIREAVDPRRELWSPFLRVVETLRPRAVLMENVPDMALGDDMRTIRYIADRLTAAGYQTDMRIIEAWRYGVPQHRQRLILVALRDAVFQWPGPADSVTLRDAIADLPPLAGTVGDRELRYSGPKSEFQRRARRSVPDASSELIHDHMTRAVRADDREAFELMATGLRYTELPSRLKRYRDDIFDDKYNRLRWDDWSRSITAHIAKDGYWYIHPSEHRTLSVREAARIQTFPDHFRFSGSRSDAFRQIGNAVPPQLAKTIAEAMLRSLSVKPSKKAPLPEVLRDSMRQALLRWFGERSAPAWQRTGQRWHVLVGTIAGRREQLAEEILIRFPTPEAVVHQQVTAMAKNAKDDRERRIYQGVGKAAGAIRRDSWDAATWAAAAQLGPSERLWVEAVGLNQKHIAATAATVRVACRLLGVEDAGGVSGRMALGQLVGYSSDASAITSALAAVGAEICTAQDPQCASCPLSKVCQTKSAVPPLAQSAGRT